MATPKIMLILSENWTITSLEQALTSIPPQLAQGYSTICVKPNQFIDDAKQIRAFCERVVQGIATMPILGKGGL